MAKGTMEQTEQRPHPSLAHLVHSYVGYRMSGFDPGTHAGLPSRHLTFIVTIDGPIDLAAMPDPAQSPGRFDAFVGGLHDAPATVRHRGHQHGVQLRLTPLGARALLRCPAGALASTVVDLADVIGSNATELTDRLRQADDWPECFAALDDVLVRLRREPAVTQPEVVHAWTLLTGSAGPSIEAVACEVGWSRRHLSERFRAEYGLTPKVLMRVVRFERASRLLQQSGASLAAVSAVAGYADQSHMTREWSRLAGATPAAWLASEGLPFVQDEPRPARASSLHGT